MLKKICVYCGASSRTDPKYRQSASKVGQDLAALGIELVYGGGNIGLMGAVADGVLDSGGRVTGVITHKLKELELAHQGAQQMYVTQGMHERKAMMAQLSDGFIALPGGYGTLEELAEATTWSQLNLHSKPVGLLNAFGFYDHLVAWIDHAAREGFIREKHRNLIVVDSDLGRLLEKMRNVEFIDLSKVI
jgi:uncharacterized protein (TIGR00730 family)